jgi:hypothetical protein
MNRPFSKGFNENDMAAALEAPAENRAAAFGAVRLKSTGGMKPVNPRAGTLPQSALLDALPPFPADDSATTAAELIQCAMATAWLADVPLRDLRTTIQAAGNPLEGLEAELGAPVRPASAFRLVDQGGDKSPMISQFLLRPFEAGSLAVDMRHRLDVGHYGYRPEALAALLNGKPIESQVTSPRTHYIHSLRALAASMRQDPPYLYGLLASCLLDSLRVRRSDLFPTLPKEAPFVFYGGQLDAQCLLVQAVRQAMSLVCWAQKWEKGSERRSRPEELLANPERLHPLWAERGAPLLARHGFGSHLPMFAASGSPIHPSFVSGHAVIGGAVATGLNAIYRDGPWPVGMVQANDTGMELVPANATAPTIHGEARKLGENYGMGRVVGGLHYLSDVRQGLLLGQRVAEQVLREAKAEAHALGLEEWGSISFEGYDGTVVSI